MEWAPPQERAALEYNTGVRLGIGSLPMPHRHYCSCYLCYDEHTWTVATAGLKDVPLERGV